MSPGLDISAEVAAAVGGRAGVWQFIRDFAGLWRSSLADGDGYGEADINAAEERLGVRFPAAVREAYELFGRRTDLTSNQDRLFRPGELRLVPHQPTFARSEHAAGQQQTSCATCAALSSLDQALSTAAWPGATHDP
jgi:hypothetical protein